MRYLGLIVALCVGLLAAAPGEAYRAAPMARHAALAPETANLADRWEDRGRYGRDRWDRRYDRRDRRWRNGRWRWRTECHRQWRRGRPERVCRRIRYRR